MINSIRDSSASLQNDGGGYGIEKRSRFHLNPAMLAQLYDSKGFVPVIIGFKPVMDIQRFLDVPAEKLQTSG